MASPTDADCTEVDDNPFRPGSELSREADLIVSLIKEGKPITPVRDLLEQPANGHSTTAPSGDASKKILEQAKRNGATPGVIEVKVNENEALPTANNVEKVVIKKDKKCCDIQ